VTPEPTDKKIIIVIASADPHPLSLAFSKVFDLKTDVGFVKSASSGAACKYTHRALRLRLKRPVFPEETRKIWARVVSPSVRSRD